MARTRGDKTPVYVEIGSLKYGFLAYEKIHNSYKSQLGQTTYQGAVGVVFGANSPKPPRATKDFSGDSVSSFCSSDKVSSLKRDNWTILNKTSRRGIKTSGKTRTVFLEMPGGWKYAWNITAAEADLASVLGFQLASGADAADLIWGVNSPKPPRATKRENGSSVSTFIAPKQSIIDKAVGAGYTVSGVNYDLLPDS
ncbi:MAG: hypothetical protein AAFN00_05145 [Cyanobacteria bacterium J06558_2]